jgi:hypothetical protein
MASAVGFTLLFIVGRFVDLALQEDGRTWLTGWPAKGGVMRETEDIPDPDGGLRVLGTWAVLVVLSYIALRVLDTPAGRGLRRWYETAPTSWRRRDPNESGA